MMTTVMVETRIFVLEANIVVNVPVDIFKNERRLKAVKEGIKRALTKGLYEQGVDFEIRKMSLKAKDKAKT